MNLSRLNKKLYKHLIRLNLKPLEAKDSTKMIADKFKPNLITKTKMTKIKKWLQKLLLLPKNDPTLSTILDR